MKQVITMLTIFVCFTVNAKDIFHKTHWKPFVNESPIIEFANNVNIRFSSEKTGLKKFVHSFEGFARYKIDSKYVYQLFTIDCEGHIVALWTQDSQLIWSEFINPAHPVWAYRNSVCKLN